MDIDKRHHRLYTLFTEAVPVLLFLLPPFLPLQIEKPKEMLETYLKMLKLFFFKEKKVGVCSVFKTLKEGKHFSKLVIPAAPFVLFGMTGHICNRVIKYYTQCLNNGIGIIHRKKGTNVILNAFVIFQKNLWHIFICSSKHIFIIEKYSVFN